MDRLDSEPQQPTVSSPLIPSQASECCSDERSAFCLQPCNTVHSGGVAQVASSGLVAQGQASIQQDIVDVLDTIQEESQTPPSASPELADAPRALRPCRSFGLQCVTVPGGHPPPPNAERHRDYTFSKPKKSTSIKSHWPTNAGEGRQRSTAFPVKEMPVRDMPQVRHAWHYGTYTTGPPSRSHTNASRDQVEGAQPKSRSPAGGCEMRVGLLGKQHLLALADKQLPELGIDSIKQEHIKFEVGSASGSGSGSSRVTGSSGGGDSRSGDIVDNRSALASMHAHAREEGSAGGRLVYTSVGPVDHSDSKARTKHNPLPAVTRGDESTELTWLQLSSSMESALLLLFCSAILSIYFQLPRVEWLFERMRCRCCYSNVCLQVQ